jgi:hypothetical protein
MQVDDAWDADAGAEKFSFLLIFSAELPDRVAHFCDDVVGPEGGLCPERDFFQELAVSTDGCDAQVGAAEIDSDRKIGHG